MATAKTSSKKATGSAKPKKKATPKTAAAKKAAADKAAADKKTKLVKVKFLKSPTGAFKLSYGVGQEAQIRETLSADLIEAGYAELV